MRTLLAAALVLVVAAACVAGEPVVQPYAGISTCRGCHQAMHPNVWNGYEKSPHAKAFDAMLNKFGGKFEMCKTCHPTSNEKVWRKDKMVCFFCHATGYANGGFDPLKEATFADFAGVTCEGCHGAMGDHAKNPMDPQFKTRIPRCYKCHMRLPNVGPHTHEVLIHGTK